MWLFQSHLPLPGPSPPPPLLPSLPHPLFQGLARFIWKWPDCRHLGLCYSCYPNSSLPLWRGRGHRQQVNKWAWLCANKTLSPPKKNFIYKNRHPIDEWISKVWYSHVTECCSEIKRNEITNKCTACMNLKCITLNEKASHKCHPYYVIRFIWKMPRISNL